ncbi:DUF748 domain-containing protein [Desulfobacterium sp. N47]|uniref:DUF748 domain-containing protein n=1 Tax=uncultured Desulfobacterium sp. TaxID=201089 RepID=E1Y9D4_9BACT|nr:hypothetical protein N47_A12070 [uncultured Desulfobacterium sp.]
MPKKIIIGALVFILVYTVFGFLILPSVLKSILTKKLSESLHRKVSIEKIKTNPYIISARIKGLTIKDQQDQEIFASISELYVNVQTESLLKRALVIKEISISKPYVNIKRKTSQLYNFSDLIKEDGKKPDTKKEPFRFFIGNIQVSGGRIDFMDSPKNKQHKVKDIVFAIPFISNMQKIADTFVQPYFRADINGTPLILEGRSKPFAKSLETVFNINLKGIDIPHYIEYMPEEIKVKVPSGTIDLQAALSYIQSLDKPPAIHVSGTLGLKNIAVNDTNNLPFIRFSKLLFKIDDIQLPEKSVHLSAINLTSPEVYIRRDKSGELNLESVIPKTNTKGSETNTETQTFSLKIDQVELKGGILNLSDVLAVDTVNFLADNLNLSANNISYIQSQNKPPVFHASGTLGLKNIAVNDTKSLPLVRLSELTVKIADIKLPERNAHLSAIDLTSPEVYIRRDKAGELNSEQILKKINAENTGAKTKSKPFPVKIDKVELKSGVFSFSDVSTTDPVNLVADNLIISANDIDTTAGGKADLSFRLNKKGSISTNTIFKIDPLSCNAKVSMEGIEPGWVQSYFTDQIRIIITGGRASTKGLFTMKQDKTKLTQISYKGNAALTDFSSVDKENKDDFVKIKVLNLNSLSVGFNPTYVDIKEIALNDFFAGIIVNNDKKLNLKSVVKQDQDIAIPSEEKDKDKEKKSIEKIMIGKVSVRKGNIGFIDRSINPNFSTELINIEGSITGLTSLETEAAKVELSGKLDNVAPLMITGSINPLKDDLFADLHTNFKDMDLSPESPYSGKFLGYTINKGKLSLDLKYLINKKKLDSQNDVYIDQFTFGDSVDSPHATSLPVGLAVSLLKDHNGKINLNLPVAGRTDDPEFSVWKVIVKMLVNLVGKAATAPFSLLASLYPGADQLSNVEFEYGKADLSLQTESKLLLLHQILTDKPSVSVEIKGCADKDKDRQAVIQYLFEKKLKARKLTKMIKKGQPAIEVDKITISPDEHELYLKEAYKAEAFAKPEKSQGKPSAQEMKQAIVDHIRVTDSDLKLLAEQRARQVKNFLLKSQQINPERIFLVEGQLISAEKSDGVSASHVELTLK